MWYYAIDGETHGPVDKAELQQLIDEGDVGLSELVWSNGMEDWQPVSEVDDIHPSPPPLPEEKDSPSPPPISKEKQDRLTGEPDPDHRMDEPFSTEEERETTAGGSRTLSDASKSTSTVNTSDADNITYAGFGGRSVAYVVDVIINFIVGSIIGALILFSDPTADLDSLSRGIGLLVAWFYFAGFESSKRQATPGKQLMGLKVTDLNGDRIGFGKATGRHFGKILSGIIFLIGFLMAAFTEKKQALHDKMAGCLVVEDT